jgi:hypothetical protein
MRCEAAGDVATARSLDGSIASRRRLDALDRLDPLDLLDRSIARRARLLDGFDRLGGSTAHAGSGVARQAL